MHVVLLTHNRFLYTSRRLIQTCLGRGHHVSIVNPFQYFIELRDGQAELFSQTDKIEKPDVIIPRHSQRSLSEVSSLLEFFRFQGVPILADPEALRRGRNKFLAYLALQAAGLPIPRTILLKTPDQIDDAFERLGSFPLIAKRLENNQGIGVMLLESWAAGRSVCESLLSEEIDLLLQPYLKEANARDRRVMVVDGKVVASIERRAKGTEFRANAHRGASLHRCELSMQEQELALQAAETIGLPVAGVDLIQGPEGSLVLEVNASPGLRAVEEGNDQDIAQFVVDYAEKLVAQKL